MAAPTPLVQSASLRYRVCVHQNERSCDYASRICGFAENKNKELGDILKKNYDIPTEINRHPGRMGVYNGAQEGKGTTRACHQTGAEHLYEVAM